MNPIAMITGVPMVLSADIIERLNFLFQPPPQILTVSYQLPLGNEYHSLLQCQVQLCCHVYLFVACIAIALGKLLQLP